VFKLYEIVVKNPDGAFPSILSSLLICPHFSTSHWDATGKLILRPETRSENGNLSPKIGTKVDVRIKVVFEKL